MYEMMEKRMSGGIKLRESLVFTVIFGNFVTK